MFSKDFTLGILNDLCFWHPKFESRLRDCSQSHPLKLPRHTPHPRLINTKLKIYKIDQNRRNNCNYRSQETMSSVAKGLLWLLIKISTIHHGQQYITMDSTVYKTAMAATALSMHLNSILQCLEGTCHQLGFTAGICFTSTSCFTGSMPQPEILYTNV